MGSSVCRDEGGARPLPATGRAPSALSGTKHHFENSHPPSLVLLGPTVTVEEEYGSVKPHRHRDELALPVGENWGGIFPKGQVQVDSRTRDWPLARNGPFPSTGPAPRQWAVLILPKSASGPDAS